jgi:hypothetical protein
MQRMEANRITKQALQNKTKEWRNIGLRTKRWREQLNLEDQGTRITPIPS